MDSKIWWEEAGLEGLILSLFFCAIYTNKINSINKN
jgi:hypothetical protein